MSWVRYNTREALLRRGGFACVYCGDELTLRTATLDHLIPQDINGPNTPVNLVVACGACNSSRKKAHWQQWVKRKFSDAAAIIRRVELQRRQRVVRLRNEVTRALAVMDTYDAVVDACPFCERPCRPCLEKHVAPWRRGINADDYVYPEEW